MIKIALAALLVSAQPAAACHHYRFWHFKEPQRCPVTTRVAYHPPAPAPDKSYFVEITTPPPPAAPTPAIKTVPLPPLDPVQDPDPRTPAQIEDQREHDAAVADKKDEINKLMIILKAKEAAQNAAGIRDP